MKMVSGLLAVACAAAVAIGQPAAPAGLGPDEYPRVDASTSTHLLVEMMWARCLGMDARMARVVMRYYGEVQETAVLAFPLDQSAGSLLRYYETRRTRANSPGTGEAYVNLVKGNCDLALVARGPSADELEAARQAKVELDARPVALDALVFIVNRENPVTALTSQQILAVYTGRTTLWKDLGGPDWPLKAIGREPNSGSQELFAELLLHGRPMILSPDRIIRTMAGTVDVVAKDRTALAYSVYFYDRVMLAGGDDRPVAIDGVAPTPETIGNRTYPLTAPVQVVVRRDAKGPTLRLRDWLLGAEGQKLIAESGYVPLPVAEAGHGVPKP